MASARYRPTTVRAMLDGLTADLIAVRHAQDRLYAMLWNRGYTEVQAPGPLCEAGYDGTVVFAQRFAEGRSLLVLDTVEACVAFQNLDGVPPVGSRVRVLAEGTSGWRVVDVRALGPQLAVRFDQTAVGIPSWLDTVRDALGRVRQVEVARRERLARQRAQLVPVAEPSSLEARWRAELDAIRTRALAQTEFTVAEHVALERARRRRDTALERRLTDERRARLAELTQAAVEAFRAERWPALRSAYEAERRRYDAYRADMLRIEATIVTGRMLIDRAQQALGLLPEIVRAGLAVAAVAPEPGSLEDPALAEALVRSVELLYLAIPRRVSIALPLRA